MTAQEVAAHIRRNAADCDREAAAHDERAAAAAAANDPEGIDYWRRLAQQCRDYATDLRSRLPTEAAQ